MDNKSNVAKASVKSSKQNCHCLRKTLHVILIIELSVTLRSKYVALRQWLPNITIEWLAIAIDPFSVICIASIIRGLRQR